MAQSSRLNSKSKIFIIHKLPISNYCHYDCFVFNSIENIANKNPQQTSNFPAQSSIAKFANRRKSDAPLNTLLAPQNTDSPSEYHFFAGTLMRRNNNPTTPAAALMRNAGSPLSSESFSMASRSRRPSDAAVVRPSSHQTMMMNRIREAKKEVELKSLINLQ